MSSIDKKQPIAGWGVPADEQQTFGSQAPFANGHASSSALESGEDETAPFLAYQPFPSALEQPSVPMQISSDAPPMYTPKSTAPPPSPPTTRQPQAPNVHPAVPAITSAPQGPHRAPAPQEYPHQQIQPIPYSPSPQNQLYQPPFASQAPMPTNYGAINFPYPNSNNYAPLPPGPLPHHSDSGDTPVRRRRRKMKAKGGSCCSCCCFTIIFIILLCWYFSRSIDGILDGSCWAPANAPSAVKSQIIDATPTVGFQLKVTDGIVGNILVKEYESVDNKIRIMLTMRASSTKLLNKMVFTNTTDPKLAYDNQFTTIHLKGGSQSDKWKLLDGNCAQVDIDILYPVSMKRKPVVTAGKLEIFSDNGEMNIVMPEDAGTILDSFHARLANGEINFQNLAVSRLTKFELTNGHVFGSLKTSGSIEAKSMNGPIDLGIDTTPLQPHWNNDEFYIEASAMSGRVTVNLAKPFHGHFDLASEIGKPAVWVQPGHNDTIKFTKTDWNKVKGWVKHNDDPEPASKLPLIDLKTFTGGVKLYVQENQR